MRTRARGVVLLAAGLLLGLACGDGMSMMGDAMVDAGQTLVDAGQHLDAAGDAMTPDAAAQPMVVTADCTAQDGSLYYADAYVDIDPATVHHVEAIMCDLEGTLSGTGGFPCTSAAPRFSATRIRVLCGSGDPTMSGYRYRTVRFVIN